MPPKPFKPPRPTPSFQPASAAVKKAAKVVKASASRTSTGAKSSSKAAPKPKPRSESVVVDSGDEEEGSEAEEVEDEDEDEEMEDVSGEEEDGSDGGSSVDVHDMEDPFASDARERSSATKASTSRRTSTNTPKTKPKPSKPSQDSRSAPSEPASRRASGRIDVDEPERENTIPTKLVSVLLKQFVGDGVSISIPADRAMGRYVDVFVREAVARAQVERLERGGGRGDDFLEVCFARFHLFFVQADDPFF
jgi:centromere protein X